MKFLYTSPNNAIVLAFILAAIRCASAVLNKCQKRSHYMRAVPSLRAEDGAPNHAPQTEQRDIQAAFDPAPWETVLAHPAFQGLPAA